MGSEDFLNLRGGFHRVTMEEVLIFLPGVWKPVYFTVYELISYTFVERLSIVGCWMGLYSVLINL